MLLVSSGSKQLHGDTDLDPKLLAQPLRRLFLRRFGGNPQNKTVLQSGFDQVLAGERIITLLRGAAAATDQPAQASLPAAVNGDSYQLQAAFEAEFSSHQKLYLQELRRHVCPYNAGNGTFIRDGDRAVTK